MKHRAIISWTRYIWSNNIFILLILFFNLRITSRSLGLTPIFIKWWTSWLTLLLTSQVRVIKSPLLVKHVWIFVFIRCLRGCYFTVYQIIKEISFITSSNFSYGGISLDSILLRISCCILNKRSLIVNARAIASIHLSLFKRLLRYF